MQIFFSNINVNIRSSRYTRDYHWVIESSVILEELNCFLSGSTFSRSLNLLELGSHQSSNTQLILSQIFELGFLSRLCPDFHFFIVFDTFRYKYMIFF